MEENLARPKASRPQRSAAARRALLRIVLCSLVLCPAAPQPCRGGANVPGFYGNLPGFEEPAVNALPVVRELVQGIDALSRPDDRTLVVHQDADKAIVEWDSFDVGADATVTFDQQGNSSWQVLNRIYDQDPSAICGRLQADGRVYLINQNGIFFSPGASVNVHTLIASSLDLDDGLFNLGDLHFTADDYLGSGQAPGVVANHGTITAQPTGAVLLLAPTVENGGTITAEAGQIGLAAGSDIALERESGRWLVRLCDGLGEATNFAAGQLLADFGIAGMYGRDVNHEGLIRSITAVQTSGRVELQASERVRTAAGSEILCPVLESDETVHQSFTGRGAGIYLDGIDPDHPSNPESGLHARSIELQGEILAPYGTLQAKAEDQVYLESGAVIDVSGLWVDQNAEDALVQMQLNSVELRDDYLYKNGVLQGEKIVFHTLAGTAVGDASSALNNEQQTAEERCIYGGTVELRTPSSGRIVLKQDSLIDVSGGGMIYGPGAVETTQVLVGGKVYGISEVPDDVTVTSLLDTQTVTHERFGIQQTYSGLYAGGGISLGDYVPGYEQGADAGSVLLDTGALVLDGRLDASVTTGSFQYLLEEEQSDSGNQTTRGIEEPEAGSIRIGWDSIDSAETLDQRIEAMVIAAASDPLPASFGPDDPYPYIEADGTTRITCLGTDVLNASGAGSIELFASTRIEMASDAAIKMIPGGELHLIARDIEIAGQIDAPAGTVEIETKDNLTCFPTMVVGNIFGETEIVPNERYVRMEGTQILLTDGSRISVAGETADNRLADVAAESAADLTHHLDGGSITISDATGGGEDASLGGLGVFVESGALLDVDGGWRIDADGAVQGGDAGSLALAGETIVLDGTLQGCSLLGQEGGKLSIHARQIDIVAPEKLALARDTAAAIRTVLAADAFAATGFDRITLAAEDDLTVQIGADLAPSAFKLDMALEDSAVALSRMPASEWLVPDTALTLSAGEALAGKDRTPDAAAKVALAAGSQVRSLLGGSVEIAAGVVEIGGTVSAPAGAVNLTSEYGDVTLFTGGVLSATGQNIDDGSGVETLAGASSSEVFDGGAITIRSEKSVIFKAGSLVDVSAAAPATAYLSIDGVVCPVEVAGDAGSLSIRFVDKLAMDGGLRGSTQGSTAKGGTVSLLRADLENEFALNASDFRQLLLSGFDDLTLASWKGICLSGSMNIAVGRRLALDAPEIRAADGDGASVSFRAPWLEIENDPSKHDSESNSLGQIVTQAAAGDATISFYGDHVTLSGATTLSGFELVRVRSGGDLQLADAAYRSPAESENWSGAFRVSGDLRLTADRIYPQTLAAYSFEVPGQMSILANRAGTDGADTSDIYSAGGSISIIAGAIDHAGVLAAPMGRISLTVSDGQDDAAGRIFLAENSVITTRIDASVWMGACEDGYWSIVDKIGHLQDGLQVGSEDFITQYSPGVAITGAEIIQQAGATIDVSAGTGRIFAYQWFKAVEGSVDPLAVAGRIVILPESAAIKSAEVIEIPEGQALAAGRYAVLSYAYAFVPGALVLEQVGQAEAQSTGIAVSAYGDPIIIGYAGEAGTAVKDALPTYYTLRSAEAVRAEGHFEGEALAWTDGGGLSLSGRTLVLEGDLAGVGANVYGNNLLAIEATHLTVAVASQGPLLPEGFGYQDDLSPYAVPGQALLSAASLDQSGFSEIVLGDGNLTESIAIEEGAALTGSSLTLAAADRILIATGASLTANDAQEGILALNCPTGEVTIQEGATLHASNGIAIDARNLSIGGDLSLDNGSLALTSEAILIVPEGYTDPWPGLEGLRIDEALWSRLDGLETLSLTSRTDIVFVGGTALTAESALVLNAQRIAMLGQGDRNRVDISAATVTLLNTNTAAHESQMDGAIFASGGEFNIQADHLVLDDGTLTAAGMTALNISINGDIAIAGQGGLNVAADLSLTAGSILAAGKVIRTDDQTIAYQTANYRFDASGYDMVLGSGAAGSLPALDAGGQIQFAAENIEIGTTVAATAGHLRFDAAAGLTLTENGRLSNRGDDRFDGGEVVLAAGGDLQIREGSSIDVGADWGTAGTLVLSAGQRLDVQGDLNGQGAGIAGSGGAIQVEAGTLAEGARLFDRLANGGFDRAVTLTLGAGDIAVAPAATIQAAEIQLTAEAGRIDIYGILDAAGLQDGGSIALYAAAGIGLHQDSRLIATGTETGAGGRVLLSVGAYDRQQDVELISDPNSRIDVSGGAAGGQVWLRAPRQGQAGVSLCGAIAGADAIVFEGYRIDRLTPAAGTATIGQNPLTAADLDYPSENGLSASQFAASVWNDDRFFIVPGLEIQTAGDLVLATDLNLTGQVGEQGLPGALTLRAGGDLMLNGSITDRPSDSDSIFNTYEDRDFDSWDIRLVAGGDIRSPDPLALSEDPAAGTATLAIANGQLVFTESGRIDIASAGDLRIGSTGSSFFVTDGLNVSLGTYDGDIRGWVGNDLDLQAGGVIQSLTGDIRFDVGSDVIMKGLAAIRTTGKPQVAVETTSTPAVWTYADGGDIRLRVGGRIDGAGLNYNGMWDKVYASRQSGSYYAANYAIGNDQGKAFTGIGALAGGQVDIAAADDIYVKAASFGVGGLKLVSGGDIDGRFLIQNGDARIAAAGNIGANLNNMAVSLMAATVDLFAQGSLSIGSIINPTLLVSGWEKEWHLTYASDSAAHLTASHGDVLITGTIPYYTTIEDQARINVLPPILTVDSGADIHLTNAFGLTPSAEGHLSLRAAGDIDGRYTDYQAENAWINVSDLDPAEVFTVQTQTSLADVIAAKIVNSTNVLLHGPTLLHDDAQPVEIIAGGSIRNIQLNLPKAATIEAGADISNLYLMGQHNDAGSVTRIVAGGSLTCESKPNAPYRLGILVGGPGTVVVSVGDSMDLGISEGIQTVANSFNQALGNEGCDLVVSAGYDLDADLYELEDFFEQIRSEGKQYSELLAAGDIDGAAAKVAQIREDFIDPFLEAVPEGQGDISMVNAQIKTSGEGDAIYILNSGRIDVGRTVLDGGDEAGGVQNTGIYTEAGGGINLYSLDDINVYESRVMTFYGGDITMWADLGSINAGRGSKTAISAPTITFNETTGKREFRPPAVGSGIRTLTYDPDGQQGAQAAPLAGDVYLFAPEGEIDAGEAGIAGTNVILGATEIVNAQNIEFSQGSVGVPLASEGGGDLGALSGAGAVAAAAQSVAEAATLDSMQKGVLEGGRDLAEQLVPKWVEVRVISFEEKSDEEKSDKEKPE